MGDLKHPSGSPWRNFYGRRHGKTLRKGQIEHLENTLPALAVPEVEWEDNPERSPVDLAALFGDERPVWLEIGFGGGEHLLHMAQTYPDVGIIGCEPFVNGVAMLLPRIVEEGVENARIHMGDARDLLDVLPEASLDKAFLLYPDPWPKARHQRRRFVIEENLVPLAQALKPGAEFRVATDIADYVRQTLEVITAMEQFEWLAEGPDDWRRPWADWTRTRYEAKALREGRTPHYLTFRRV